MFAITQSAPALAGAARPGIRLAAWQLRRVAAHIDSNLDSQLTVDELARLAGVSCSHFARAFNGSVGCSPHRFVMHRRVERAQQLMLMTDAPLLQIALDCGLADQSHLSRVFLRFVGETPARWRREARTAAPVCPGAVRANWIGSSLTEGRAAVLVNHLDALAARIR